jgi:His-Xaa-Ser system radical SAM maturase HxsB
MNPYLILPFHHKRFPDSYLLLVNEVGEYYFIKSEDFERFINYSLSKEETLFLDLKSKHFLTDTNIELPVRLLATKYRTKRGFLKNFTSLHMMVITVRCNHRCSYCQVSSKEPDAYKWDMNKETAQKIVDTIFMSPSPEIKIEFQGGEPLINWEVVKYTIEYAEKINLNHQKHLEFVICTNLVSIDANMLKFIKDHNVNISSSLDGPQSIHDANRFLRSGGSSYNQFIEKLELSRSVLGYDRIAALMTTTNLSLANMNEIIDAYMDNGFDGIFIRSLNPYGFAKVEEETLGYKINDFIDAYLEALSYIIELNLKGHWFVEYYASLLLSRILTPFSTGFVDLQSPSGAGISGVIYDYNGDVYPADEARMLSRMEDQKFLMGNVFHDDYFEIFDGTVLRDIIEKSCVEIIPSCFSCAFQTYCGADPIRNYVDQNDIMGHMPSSNFCRKNKYIIRWLFEKLKENDEKITDVFWSWVNRRPLKRIHNATV